MPFFEPLPPKPPEPVERKWAPPAWDRPSDGTIPAIFPVNQIVHQTAAVAIAIEYVAVYPNGFTIQAVIRRNPQDAIRPGAMSMMMMGMRSPRDRPRMGVRFADGRAGGDGWGFGGMHGIEKDEAGFPTNLYIGMQGGGGGSGEWNFGIWVYPLPPDGPLDIMVSLPSAGLDEGSITIDGEAVREAAHAAKVIWD